MQLRTIVVGYDESESAERALARAAGLAEAFGAKLVVASVATPAVAQPGIETALPATPARLAATTADELDLADRHLERARAAVAGRELDVEFVSEVGSPVDRIVAVADERAADLIVVGTREPGFLERLLGGSVSEEVSRTTRRDVMIVH